MFLSLLMHRASRSKQLSMSQLLCVLEHFTSLITPITQNMMNHSGSSTKLSWNSLVIWDVRCSQFVADSWRYLSLWLQCCLMILHNYWNSYRCSHYSLHSRHCCSQQLVWRFQLPLILWRTFYHWLISRDTQHPRGLVPSKHRNSAALAAGLLGCLAGMDMIAENQFSVVFLWFSICYS